MFKTIITPRFGDTDALQHINNVVPAAWFEQARIPFFKIFTPKLTTDYKAWKIVLVHSDYDFLDQLYFGEDVEIHSYISHIGNSSFTISHKAFQGERLCVTSNAVHVHYDFVKKEKITIPNGIREQLMQHCH